jgi:hypothetical protein
LTTRIWCPHLGTNVELTNERERHIATQHPELVPDHLELVEQTLADPDLVRRSPRLATARLFSRWYDNLRGGKHVVVVVVSETMPSARHWVVTAYIARRLAGGDLEWSRS